MINKLKKFLLPITFLIIFYPTIMINTTSGDITLDNDINFNIEYEFSFANSPIIFHTQVSDITGVTGTQFVMGSRYLIVGYNAISNDEIWRIQLSSNDSTSFTDMKNEPLLTNDYPTKFFIALSNGTVMQINKDGVVIWTKLLKSKNNCSNINCSRSISILSNELDLENPFKLVLGGSDLTAYFLFSNGSLISNFTLNSPITIMKTLNNFTAIGTQSGQIYLFNNPKTILWNKEINNSIPIISIGIASDNLIVNTWNESLISLDLLNGQISSQTFELDENILTLDAIYIAKETPFDVYLSFLFGSISKFNSNGNLVWKSQLDANSIINLDIANISGSHHSDLVVTTDIGSIFIINDTNGKIISEISAFSEQISYLNIKDINGDGFDDISVGSLSGTVKIIFGKDLVPPRFITPINYELSKSNLLYIQTLTDEETTSTVVLEAEGGIITVIQNDTLRLNQTYFISQLESDKIYAFQITIYDSYNNSNISEKITILTNKIVEIPWDLYFAGLVIVISTIIFSYLLFTFILRKRYYNLAENAIKLGDYSKGIRLYFKAKNQEKIVETVKVILNNPELANKMNEIAQAAELEDYITEIYDLIAQEG